MGQVNSERLADLLDRLATRMREDGDAIIAEAEWIRGRIDEEWHLGPIEAGRHALRTAAARLSMSEEDLSLLVKVVWHARE